MNRTKTTKFITIFLLLILSAVCFAQYTEQKATKDNTEITVAQSAEKKYAEGEVIVISKLPDGVTLYDKPLKEASKIIEMLATELADKVGGTASPYISISINNGNIMTLIRNKEKTTEELLEFYKKLDGVLSVEPNYIQELSQTDETPITVTSTCTSPDDPYYTDGTLWGLAKINAPVAWRYTDGSKDCMAVIIDSGLDYENEDLVDNLASWSGDYSGSAVVRVMERNEKLDDKPIKVSGGFDYSKRSNWDYVFKTMGDTGEIGHGTHCTGIIGATGNNSKGVTGVCQKASLLNVSLLRVTSTTDNVTILDDFTDAQIIEALDFIVKQKNAGVKIKVVSISLGGGTTSNKKTVTTDSFYQALKAVADSGIIICAAAGNKGVSLDPNTGITHTNTPSDYCLLINKNCTNGKMFSVGNIQKGGTFSSSSNYGKQYVLIAAPGTNIMSTVSKYRIMNSSVSVLSDSGYGSMTGTSMATPYVAGCCTLVWSLFPNKGAEAIMNLFTGTATQENLNKCTYGTINVGAAMIKAYTDWGVKLDKTSISVILGETGTLTATCAETTDINWTSSNESVATVDENGKITPVSPGTAEISATSNTSGFVAKCTVTVIKGGTPTLDPTTMSLYVGDEGTIKATVSSGDITWSSSDEGIAKVDSNGKVTAVSVGKANIKATSESGDSAVCEVSVNEPYTPTLNKTELSLSQGMQEQLTAKVASGKVIWSSEDEDIAAVSANGTVVAKNVGTTNIVVTSETGHTAKCKVTVSAYTPTLDAQSVTVTVGDSRTLSAGTYDGSIVTWSYDNSGIVSIEAQGNKVTIKGLAQGTATVTATAENGNSISCTVTVKAQESSSGSSGGGGGCNAGFGMLALLMIAPLAFRKKK